MTLRHSIETLSGSMFDFDAPRAADVDVEDIARALGNTCRFAGHVSEFYSVAEHAVLCYWLVRDQGFSAEIQYAALHHDSHEAYLGDTPTPLKRKIKAEAPWVWERLEEDIDRAVCRALGIRRPLLDHNAVKAADTTALSYEAAKLKPSGQAQRHDAWVRVDPAEVPTWCVQCWTPAEAAQQFYDTHLEAARRAAR